MRYSGADQPEDGADLAVLAHPTENFYGFRVCSTPFPPDELSSTWPIRRPIGTSARIVGFTVPAFNSWRPVECQGMACTSVVSVVTWALRQFVFGPQVNATDAGYREKRRSSLFCPSGIEVNKSCALGSTWVMQTTYKTRCCDTLSFMILYLF